MLRTQPAVDKCFVSLLKVDAESTAPVFCVAFVSFHAALQLSIHASQGYTSFHTVGVSVSPPRSLIWFCSVRGWRSRLDRVWDANVVSFPTFCPCPGPMCARLGLEV